jgi:DNA-binding transcriptional ArsR family regulator
MPISKYYLFDQNTVYLAQLLKAMSCPTRLFILDFMHTHGTVTNKQLVEAIGELSQSTISGHLKHLKEANLITATQRETSMIYSLNEPLWSLMRQVAGRFAEVGLGERRDDI